jgi:hypothetical protein
MSAASLGSAVCAALPWDRDCSEGVIAGKDDRTMADDKSKRGPQDGKLISMKEDYEVEYWTKKFGVSRDELAAAVKEVGHSAAAVEKHLRELAATNDESIKAAQKMPSLKRRRRSRGGIVSRWPPTRCISSDPRKASAEITTAGTKASSISGTKNANASHPSH